jgi:hypothetical protein
MRGKGFYVPFPENQVEAKHSLKIYAFFENEKSRKWTEFEI